MSDLLNAVVMGNRALVESLMKAADTDVDYAGSDGCTALMYAAARCDSATVKLLLQAGASKTVKDNSGLDAVAYAFASGDEDVMALLTEGSREMPMAAPRFARSMSGSSTGTRPSVYSMRARRKSEGRKRGSKEVFLGGACNPTTWRKEIAIPMLERAEVTYYNPQVDEWRPELVRIEAVAKRDAAWLFFVITGTTRGVSSMIEASELIAAKRNVVLVVQDIKPGTTIGGQAIVGAELKDLNRGRAYLTDVAKRRGMKVYGSVSAAMMGFLSLRNSRLRLATTRKSIHV